MKKAIILIAGALLALTTTAMAGVILDQEVTSEGPFGSSNTKRTLQIQGHQQKVLNAKNSVITDLDRGVMILIDPAKKTYTEMPFPPSHFSMNQAAGSFRVKFKKTGKHQTANGYACDEYLGSGHTMMGDYTVTGCFSKQAPGAADYIAFDKALEAKLKGTPMETEGARPEGVPLLLNSRTKVDAQSMPGLPPEKAKAVASHPNMTSSTRTTSVKVAALPADTFSVPAGYSKTELPPMGGAMPPGHPPVGKSGALPKVPE